MPHLVFRGLGAEPLRSIAEPLARELAALCGCGTDNFTMNILASETVFGAAGNGPAFIFIEVGWFERGRDTRDSFARLVTEYVGKLGDAEIEIVFHAYREDSYYIDGEPVQA
ncbi:DUF1904 domain-containing protein [Paenibacillus sp. N4]|uniref:DUF1904 family protein n=1 Tax=Paenibacillus vietnamensis TaxID=2590547 RepID=UPI001CD055E9|nr:DUF1904 family protein [Paenibacillus vietnamensis]MCA0757453.1 DUF1904 domain-containing protein [Paenibacillus vietnamensis]